MKSISPTASERLIQSREKMRLALQELGLPASQNGFAGAEVLCSNRLNSLKTTQGANMLLNLVQNWWCRQPWRVSLALTYEAAKVLLQPIAQRHPWGLVAGAAASGALIVLTQPWRRIPKPALWSGLLPLLIARVLQQSTPATKVDAGLP